MPRPAVLITRAWPKSEALASFDQWQISTHLPQLTALRGVTRASYHHTRTTGIPQAWQGSGVRMAAYWSAEVDDLMNWMTDPGLAAAITDGSQFFDRFNELDDSTYTGNAYELGAKWPGDLDPALTGALFIQRFEVHDSAKDRFDDWVIRQHLPSLRSIEGIGWVQWGKAIRGLPVSYYNSPGNRVVFAELGDLEIPPSPGTPLDRALVDSLGWDRQLGYVRREIDDGMAVFEEGRAKTA